jgi:archaemetzincin
MADRWKGRLALLGVGLGSGLVAGALAFFLAASPSSESFRCRHCPPPARPAPPPVPEEGHSRLGPPKPGEWRAHFHEPEQTFETYAAEAVNLRCAHRTTFYLQPLDAVVFREKETLSKMRDYAERFFGVPAKVLDPIPLPLEHWNDERDQYNASGLIDHLAARVPADALVFAGITDEDLYSPGLNFVFGQGSLQRRTGVYSLRRFKTKDPKLFLRRSINLMAHEAGHIFSVGHCVVWSCVMQGANSLSEGDAHPAQLCPEDLRKLEWNMGFDREGRYRNLLDFYRREGLDPEASWVEGRMRP